MDIHHSISQNTVKFLDRKKLISKLTVVKNKSLFINMELNSSDVSSHWAYKYGQLTSA